jgi:hypothetical protein
LNFKNSEKKISIEKLNGFYVDLPKAGSITAPSKIMSNSIQSILSQMIPLNKSKSIKKCSIQ